MKSLYASFRETSLEELNEIVQEYEEDNNFPQDSYGISK